MFVLLCPSLAPAQSSASLSLADAIELTRLHHPLSAAFAAETTANQLEAQFAALPPGFALETELENFAGSGNASGVNALESTLRLATTIELGGKRQLRRGIGNAEADRLLADQTVRRLDLTAEIARRFIHVLSDQELLATTRRATDLARATRDVVKQRVDAGAASPAALSRAEIALARAGIDYEHAEHELASSRMKLSALWGDSNAAFGSAQGDLFALPNLDSFDDYRQRLAENPDLLRRLSESRLQEARIQLAAAKRFPDINVAAGVRRLEALDDQAFVTSFSVPLGTRKRADLERRAAQAERTRLEMDRQAQELELRATLFDLYQEIIHARTEAEALRLQIQPQAVAMMRTTDEGFRAGRFSQLELADAQTQLLDIERQAVEAAANFHTLLVEIHRVTGAAPYTLRTGGTTP
jgi:cobalt-zinc-cadmium efflux system outer membrane protein